MTVVVIILISSPFSTATALPALIGTPYFSVLDSGSPVADLPGEETAMGSCVEGSRFSDFRRRRRRQRRPLEISVAFRLCALREVVAVDRRGARGTEEGVGSGGVDGGGDSVSGEVRSGEEAGASVSNREESLMRVVPMLSV